MFELIYTSAPQGLRAGASGYTVVAQTAGIPVQLANALEGLSQYRHRRVSAHARPGENPVIYSHLILNVGFQQFHALSRIVDAGLDYSGRGNFLAHHIAANEENLPSAGPSWVLAYPNVFLDQWNQSPTTLSPRGRMRSGDLPLKPCRAWESLTGDAGWGGVLAASVDPARPAIVVFQPGQDVLPLVTEALALLSPDERWQVSFSTYYLGTPSGVRCQWRFVPSDSPDLPSLVASGQCVVIRVDQRTEEEPQGSLVEVARTGQPAPVKPVRSTPSSIPSSIPATISLPAMHRIDLPSIEPIRPRSNVPTPRMDREVPIPQSQRPERDLQALADAASEGGGLGRMVLGVFIGAFAVAILLLGIEVVADEGLLGLIQGRNNTKNDEIQKYKDEKAAAIQRAKEQEEKHQKEKDNLQSNINKLRNDYQTVEAKTTSSNAESLNEIKKLQDEVKRLNEKLQEERKRADSEEREKSKLQQKLKDIQTAKDKKSATTNEPANGRGVKIGSLQRGGGLRGITCSVDLDKKPFELKPILWAEKLEDPIMISSPDSEKELSFFKYKNKTDEIGLLTCRNIGGKWKIELKPSQGDTRTPQLQAGIIIAKMPGEINRFFLGYKVYESEALQLTRTSKDNKSLWHHQKLRDNINKEIDDYIDYISRDGRLMFGEPVKLRVNNELITLTPQLEDKDGRKQTGVMTAKNSTAESREVNIQIAKDGDLVVYTPPSVEKCEIVYARVVRPVKPEPKDEFYETQLPVFTIGKP